MRPKKVILCVDDNDQVLSVRKFVLETRGYRVLTANHAEQAIELYDQGRVDLVIADLVMPHCNGNDLIQRLKEIAPWVPAVLVSGSIKQFDPTSRADAFLPKGASSPQELLERVRMLLVRKRGPKKLASGPTAAVASDMVSAQSEVREPGLGAARGAA